MISLEDARQTAKVLIEAADQCPVRTIAGSLRARGREWLRACKYLEVALEDGEAGEIVPAAALSIGCSMWTGEGPVEVLRVVNGGTGIQVHQLGGGTWYENPLEGSSPVVVL